MSAHVLLNLLKELGKRDKMRGLLSILSLFRNEYNKFNNVRFYLSYEIKITLKSNFCRKYIEDIQIFGMNMPFISSSEAKNAYFMSGEATNEIYIFSLHEMK